MKRGMLVFVALVVLTAAIGQGQRNPSSAGDLDALTQGIATGKVQVIDLTQPLTPDTPVIQLPPPFANTPGFKKHEISNFDPKGPAWYWNWIEVGEHADSAGQLAD